MPSWLLGRDLPVPNEPAEKVRQRADDILSRSEFRPPSKSLWQRLLDWFGERINDLFDAAGGGNPVVAWIIVAVIAIGVLAVIARSIRALQRDPGTGGVKVEGGRRPPADWRAEAARHEAAGDWRAAVRAHFRALVAELAVRGLVNEVPGRTTGEYRVEVGDSVPSASSAFSSVSRIFEDAWYARVDIRSEDNSRVKSLSSAVLEEASR